jgi:hypothetical protein
MQGEPAMSGSIHSRAKRISTKNVLASNEPAAVRLVDDRALFIGLASTQLGAFEAQRDHL